MTFASVALLALLSILAGDGVLRPAADARAASLREGGIRWPLALAAGFVALHVLLSILDLAGVPWSRVSILIPLGLLALAGLRGSRPLWRTSPAPEAGTGDLIALAAILPFAASAVLTWSISPDYIYHWGVKAEKFFLARGVDWKFLAEDWLWFVHPDYPNLVPNLFVATGILRGIYRITAAVSWSPLLAVAILLTLRSLLGRSGIASRARSWALVGLGAFLGFSGITFRRAGDPDWMIAFAVCLGVWLLLAERPDREDGAVGITAALAAASKMEGMPLAAILVTLHLARRWRSDGLPSTAGWLRLSLPGALVTVPWAWGVYRHDLFLPTNAGPPNWDATGSILAQMTRSALHPGWWGFGVLAASLVLLLPFRRKSRWPGLLLVLQLGFYFTAYLITPIEAVDLVRSSFPRLLAHLAPAALALGVVWLAGDGTASFLAPGREASPQPQPASSSS